MLVAIVSDSSFYILKYHVRKFFLVIWIPILWCFLLYRVQVLFFANLIFNTLYLAEGSCNIIY